MKQLKYLLIVPLLVTMLVYVSCTDAAKDEILEMESLLEQNEAITEGKYLDLEQGKTFVGRSLAGEIVPYEEYTQKEKEFYDKYNAIPNSMFEFYIVIDKKGERIRFIKTTAKSDSYKIEREYLKGEDVPFAIINDVPVFPGCEGSQETLRKCLQEEVTKHVNRNFNSTMAKGLGLSPGVKRIFVIFKIDKDGNISDVKSRAPHIALQEEAIRVINLLPKMIPGKHLGENVGVKYSLPIAFKVEGDKVNAEQNAGKTKRTNKDLKEKPLYFLDGVEISKEDMLKLEPSSIQSMDVIKGENAIKKYGTKGKNGVIEITKKPVTTEN